MKKILLTTGVISAVVLMSVFGFLLMRPRLPPVAPPTVAPVQSVPALSQPVANAAIHRRIPIVTSVALSVVKQWNGVTENMDFSPDGRWLAQSTNVGVEIRQTKSWKRFRLFKNVGGALDFSGDSKLLAVQTAGIWRVDSGRLLHQFGGSNVLLGPVSFSPDARSVATLTWPESVTTQGPSIYPAWIAKDLKVWNFNNSKSPKVKRGLDSDDNGFSTIVWRDVANAGQTAMWKAELVAGHGDVTRVAGHEISVNVTNRSIQSSDATTGELLSRAKRMSKIGPIAVAPDATLFAGADAADPFVYIWRLPDGKLLDKLALKGAREAIGLAFSSDASQLAVSAVSSPANSSAPRVGTTTIYQLNATQPKTRTKRTNSPS